MFVRVIPNNKGKKKGSSGIVMVEKAVNLL